MGDKKSDASIKYAPLHTMTLQFKMAAIFAAILDYSTNEVVHIAITIAHRSTIFVSMFTFEGIAVGYPSCAI